MWTAKDETWIRMKALKNLLQHVQVKRDVETWQHVWQYAGELRRCIERANSLRDWTQALELLTQLLQALQIQALVMKRTQRLRRQVRRLSGEELQALPWKTARFTLVVGAGPGTGQSNAAFAHDPALDAGPVSLPAHPAPPSEADARAQAPEPQAAEASQVSAEAAIRPTDLLTQAETETAEAAATATSSASVERFPTIEAPATVPAGQVFRVMVQVLEQNVTGTLGSLQLDTQAALDITAQLVVTEPSVLRVLGPDAALIRLPAHGNSVGIFFELEGLRPQQTSIDVRFLQGGLVRGRVSCPLEITAAQADERGGQSPTPVVRQAAAGFTPFLPAAMLLTVLERQRSDDGTELYVVLNQQTYVQDLPEKFREQLQQLCLDLKQEIRSEDDETRELRLQSLGLRLAGILLPRDVRAVLQQAPEGTPLHIQSDALWIPWELLRLGNLQAGVYLGEHFAISRSLKSGPHRLDLHRGSSVLVAVPTDLDPEAERAALAQISGQTPEVLSRPRETMMRMREGSNIAFMHFVCHGKAQESELMGGRLLLEDKLPLSAADIPGLEVVGEPAPLKGSLVFVNACQAGVPTLNLGGFGSFADAFLLAGASAVVLPSWSVGDRSAVQMAVAFYQALDRGIVPAEALRQARLETRADGSSYSHAYALYAQPDVRLTV